MLGTFDDFEEHLYYSSQSYVSNSFGEFIPFSWPKTTGRTPYTLAGVDSTAVKEWYGQIDNPTGDYYNAGVLYSASKYDSHNDNALITTVPAHIRYSEDNDLYVKFVNMIGDHYDQLYLYIKHLLDIHSRKHPLYEGTPKKLLEPILKSFGWKPFQSFDFDDLWSYNFGTDGSGSFGAAYNNHTSDFSESMVYSVESQKSESFSKDDIGKELWKRILNNLPYILKTKGTEESIRSVISTYGLPSTILKIHEYGGPQKLPGRHSKNIYDRFSYALKLDGVSSLTGSWAPASSSLGHVRYPDTVEFRINIPDKSENKKDMALWNLHSGSVAIWIEHTSSYIANQSHSAYGRINLALRSGSLGDNYTHHRYMTCSTAWAPIYDNDWWTIMATRRDPGRDTEVRAFTSSVRLETHEEQDIRYELYCKKMSDFSRFGRINWAVSGSLTISGSLGEPSKSYNRAWGGISHTSASTPITSIIDASNISTLKHYFGGATASFAGDNFLYNSASNTPTRYLSGFSGSVQEFRIWLHPLSESIFDYHVQSPQSIAGRHVTSSYDDLLVRWSLGADLMKFNISHSTVISSSEPDRGSRLYGTSNLNMPTAAYLHGFGSGSGVGSEYGYSEEEERYFTLMPRSIGPTTYSEKIRIEDNKLIGQLHPIMTREYSSFDKNPLDSNKLGIFFSPTDEIDLDITNELGPFEFDDFVGDPRDTYLKKYTLLKRIRDHYWKKHSGNPSFFEYLKIIRYFDDSLFRTVRQLIPARAKGQVGLLVKPHLLERPRILKYPSASKYDYGVQVDIPHKYDQVQLEGHINIIESSSFTGYSGGESGPFTYTGLQKKQSSNNRQGTRMGGYMLTPSHSNAGIAKSNFRPQNKIEAERGLDNRTVGELEGDYKYDKFGYDLRGYGSRYIHTTVEFPPAAASVAADGAKVWNAYYKRDAVGMTIHTPPHGYLHQHGTFGKVGYNYDNFTASKASDVTDGYVRYGLNRKVTSELYIPFISQSRKSFERYKNLYYYATAYSESLGKAIPEQHIRNWGESIGYPTYKNSRLNGKPMPSHSLSESAEYQDFKQTPLQNLYWHGCKLIGSDFNMETAQTVDGGPVVEFYDVSPHKYVAADEGADGKILTAGEGAGDVLAERESMAPVGRRYERPAGGSLRGSAISPRQNRRGN